MQALKKYPFKENPFPIVLTDIVSKCDMKCNICYSSDYMIDDLDLGLLEEAVSQFPKKGVCVILLGGEPALSPKLFDYIEVINKHGHVAFVSTNGKRISMDEEFVEKLSSYYKDGDIRIHLDMSGGLNPDLYERISNDKNTLTYKLGALKNFRKYGIGRVTISGVLVRGLNEEIIEDIFQISKDWSDVVQEIFFRPQVALGKHLDQTSPYTTNEFLNILLRKKLFKKNDMTRVITSGWMFEQCRGKNCCFRVIKDGLSIGFFEVMTQSCWQRGKLSNDDHYLVDFYDASKRDYK